MRDALVLRGARYEREQRAPNPEPQISQIDTDLEPQTPNLELRIPTEFRSQNGERRTVNGVDISPMICRFRGFEGWFLDFDKHFLNS
jgi:hypothetical protein